MGILFVVILIMIIFAGAMRGSSSGSAARASSFSPTSLFDFISRPSASAIGRAGERRVNSRASWKLDSEVYELLANVTIPTKSGGTTQIDHIILSEFGIFVIETKNYKGWIFGSPNNREWTQVLYREKHRLQNPIKQNAWHIRALADLLGLPTSKFHNVVCFAGVAEFKTVMPDCVQFDTTYVDYIKSFRNVLLSKRKLGQLSRILKSGRFPESRETDQMHVLNVRTKAHQKREPGKNCPSCGSSLVLRTARKGPSKGNQFRGCSGFPSCRYTANA